MEMVELTSRSARARARARPAPPPRRARPGRPVRRAHAGEHRRAPRGRAPADPRPRGQHPAPQGRLPRLERVEDGDHPRHAVRPVSENLIHVDLQEVAMDRPIQVSVAVHHVGEPVGVRENQGILEMILREVQVSCLPANIPDVLEADVSGLHIDDVLTVKDLNGARGRAHPERPESGRRDGGAADRRGSRDCRERRRPWQAPGARSAHRAQAGEGQPRTRGRRQEEVGGPGASSASAIPGRSTGTPATTSASASWTGWPAGSTRASRARPVTWWRRRAGAAMPLYLIKLGSFMNVSGPAAARLCKKLHLGPADLIIVFDDLDLPLGNGARADEGQRGRPQRRALPDRRARHEGPPPRQDRHRPPGAPGEKRAQVVGSRAVAVLPRGARRDRGGVRRGRRPGARARRARPRAPDATGLWRWGKLRAGRGASKLPRCRASIARGSGAWYTLTACSTGQDAMRDVGAPVRARKRRHHGKPSAERTCKALATFKKAQKRQRMSE